ncbi:MAG: hypothetical protein AAFQ65_09815 [Myxococcota bacterium]
MVRSASDRSGRDPHNVQRAVFVAFFAYESRITEQIAGMDRELDSQLRGVYPKPHAHTPRPW